VKIAVILSACGFRDGSEIHESVLCLLAISQKGHEAFCFAPDQDQHVVINHLTGTAVEDSRNVLVESARIARGDIKPLDALVCEDFDALLLPGGFGAALNLSTFGLDQNKYTVIEDLNIILKKFFKLKKIIGATCIAPVILAKVFEGLCSLKMTLGREVEMENTLKKMGMESVQAGLSDCVSDYENKIFSTPCYMESGSLSDMFIGVQKMLEEMENSFLAK